ncbi:hypothetical protein AB0284_21570 [Pseudarthrobacter phenanthrenivorans]|uniref:hypothetical protein n=1 Tax=Pseudarthrobacter phenanthrenivorans TaxID=361575 RepID=UPI00344BB978
MTAQDSGRADVPKRMRNGATGYAYGPSDHTSKWLMPDGSERYVGWIAPGDTSTLDKAIDHADREIAKLQSDIALWKALREGVVAERG